MYNQQQSSQPQSHHHVRLYIVTITVVIGGILFLLLLNNNPDGKFSLTSAVISAKNTTFIENLNDNTGSNSLDKAIPTDSDNTNDISFTLTSTEIPPTQRGAKFQSLDLSFKNTGSTITVNSDKLELNNLDQVDLGLRGFTGTLDFDGTKFGLEGTAHELDVNGITLSSNQEIKISFANLDYTSAHLLGLEVADLEFNGGNGALTIPDKLSYQLEEGQSILVDNYIGSIMATHEAETAAFTLEGTARGVDVIGSMLNVNLR